jgi:hypothetical protein
MGTLTLRIPKVWVGNVNAAQVRAWITTYSVVPEKLVPVRVALEARVSWRVPLHSVRDLARKLICSPGEAVRRVVAAALRSGAQSPVPRVQRVDEAPVVEQTKSNSSVIIQPSPKNESEPLRIVSEEIFGQDSNGCVVVLQRDARGFGYTRTLPMSRAAYLRMKRS